MAILISTPQQLNSIRSNLTGAYELTNDIDMGSFGNWNVVLNFAGSIDGKGFKIINLTNISTANTEATACALVSNTTNTKSFTVKNLGLENIKFNNTTSAYRMGGITNHSYNATIENCWVTGTMTTNTVTGGIAALFRGTGSIKNCWTNVTITTTGNSAVAGISAQLNDTTTIQNSYALGKLTGNYRYAISGSMPASATGNYWDAETTTIATGSSGLGVGKTTAEMKQQSTYTGWNFTDTWYMYGYPQLRVFGVEVLPPNISTVNVSTYVNPILSVSERHTDVLRTTEGYLSQIDSNVSMSLEIVRNTIRNLQSHMSPIHSSTHKEIKTVRRLLAVINSLEGGVDVLTLIEYQDVIAFVSCIHNPSNAVVIENPSEIRIIENLSSVSEVANPSEVRLIQNPSHSEVIEL